MVEPPEERRPPAPCVLPPMPVMEKIHDFLASMSLADDEQPLLLPQSDDSSEVKVKPPRDRRGKRRKQSSRSGTQSDDCRVLMMHAQDGNTDDNDTHTPKALVNTRAVTPGTHGKAVADTRKAQMDNESRTRHENTEAQDTHSQEACQYNVKSGGDIPRRKARQGNLGDDPAPCQHALENYNALRTSA